jgi:2-polyprenyl-3-methyl-5-hydroxy-6-metoxy-1,4-benzoquinol methylase
MTHHQTTKAKPINQGQDQATGHPRRKFRNRSYEPELLDQPGISFDDIRRNMYELDRINTLLGGHDITIRGIRKLCGDARELHVCEIGCGGGDNLRAICRWADRNDIRLRTTGIDINPACIRYARERNPDLPRAVWISSDYRKAMLEEKPDIVFSSLFCHHFDDAGVSEIFRWSAENSRLGFFMNDLHRHSLAYHAISLLTKVFSRSYLVKNDAPLSVARGFSRDELTQCLRHALGPENPSHTEIAWAWAFRWLLTCRHPLQRPH